MKESHTAEQRTNHIFSLTRIESIRILSSPQKTHTDSSVLPTVGQKI